MIGRADIEGSKSDVAKNAWPPQASYPFGNFSDTSGFRSRTTKGSLGHSFEVRISTGDRNQGSFYPFVRREISLLAELPFGHPRCLLTDVPPQPNSPPDDVFGLGAAGGGLPGPAARSRERRGAGRARLAAVARKRGCAPSLHHQMRRTTTETVVFQVRPEPPTYATFVRAVPRRPTRVKLNRVFFPRRFRQARSLGCGFAGV